MPTIKTWPTANGIKQTQLEGLSQNDIWVFRVHKDGIQLQRPGCGAVSIAPRLALDFARSIIEVVETQCHLYGWPVG